MAVKVTLSNGAEFVLQTSLEEFKRVVELALENDRVLEVENGGGKMRMILPSQIAFVEELDLDYDVAVEEALAAN